METFPQNQVTYNHPSKYFSSLSSQDRMWVLEKLILSCRTRFVLTDPSKDAFNSQLPIEDQEQIVRDYLSQGTLRRLSPDLFLYIILTLLKHIPFPLFPSDPNSSRSNLSERDLLAYIPRDYHSFYTKFKDLLLEGMNKAWFSKEIAIHAFSEVLVNYKSTKRVYTKCMEMAQSICS
jgi:hypothetical protein